jgi:hypothetical protein
MKTIDLRIATAAILFGLFAGCSSDSNSGSCELISCQNDGMFVNCACDCPEGYTGEDCGTELSPSEIWITKIRVRKFANSDGITGWDGPSSSPDIRMEIEKGMTSIFLSDLYYPNVLSSGNDAYDFNLANPMDTVSGNSILNVILWDYDQEDTIPLADDYMNSAYFSPYSDFSGFPPSMTVDDPSGNYRFEIFLTFEWN